MKALIVVCDRDIMEISMGHKLSKYLFGHSYSILNTYPHNLRPSNFGVLGEF